MKKNRKLVCRTYNKPDDVCEISAINPKKVLSVSNKMEATEALTKVAETFGALGDLTRTKIISALVIDELCVCDLAALLKTTKSAVSHQLRVLRNMRLVKYRKEGKMVFYSLDDEHIINLIGECLRHVHEA
ncbi:MAG TPA: metalloregulator ArsR/SmtB family transcription factor [Dissulfurispiraceae bacterium]|nr:metalloregulator ArsR/SmtB family transcription factor [Dissulfurispiraceae bacterium]